jgi:hypothetical protein
MDGIGAGIGDAVGGALAGFFGDPVTSLVVRLVGAYVVLVWLAVALWAFVDMRRRTNNLVAAYAAAALIILASPVLFLPALIVHRIVRPAEFMSERRVAHLREAALEAETLSPRCPECRRPVEEDWLLCPGCRRPLGHRCHACGGTVGLDWPVCAWCGEELDAARPIGIAMRA